MNQKKVSIPTLKRMKAHGEKISMLTAYDALIAKLVDESGVDMVLVGDSLGMVFQGHDDTLPVTMDEMVYHTRAVKRTVTRAFIVADLPFMSYQVSTAEAVHNAGRLLKEGRADAVKLECGGDTVNIIRQIVKAGIPVMGHVGLGPQSYKQLGGHCVQGKNPKDIRMILQNAKEVEEAGAFSIVIEAVPWPVAKRITESVNIPTIGIGAGPYCDGQVLVYADMLGLFTAFQPHFVRRFANLGVAAKNAFSSFHQAVKEGSFPTLDESYSIDNEIVESLDGFPASKAEPNQN